MVPLVLISDASGLRQGDPLSLLLFVLAADMLSTIFSHALSTMALCGVSLPKYGNIFQLQYANDFIILITYDMEDLKTIKLTLYLFEGISGLTINFHKTCHYSTKFGTPPEQSALNTLNCTSSRLPIIYLGVPIAGRRPRRQEWKKLIASIRSGLFAWKANLLSIRGRLTLINLVMSAILIYLMSIFKLPTWVMKSIDHLISDFLLGVEKPKYRLAN